MNLSSNTCTNHRSFGIFQSIRYVLVMISAAMVFSSLGCPAEDGGQAEEARQASDAGRHDALYKGPGKVQAGELGTAPVDGESHLLVDMELAEDGLRVLSVRRVRSGLPKHRLKSLQRFAWRYELLAPDGRVVFVGGMDDPRIVRGEFQNKDDPDKIDSYRFVTKNRARFSVRVPDVGKGCSIRLKALKARDLRKLHPADSDFEVLGSAAIDIGGE